ncbi:hypothetical protein [Rhizobium halophytocola]|uniref:Transmembrane protein n=1 Tax=Rhizobium halophytocola TaxID=735519 RepID=A0ABS4E546_9HYPH|nr:hypothetical protein [Rhizobium halophytocola]MBP1853060.1 hypothetical protein [Rhizobium halophytocola]
MLTALPLTIIPFLLYNLAVFSGLDAGAGLSGEMFAVNMLSGARWAMSFGDGLILIGLVLLFAEILKSTRPGSASLINHMLSMLVFVAYLVEFLLVVQAATQIFFLLMIITLIDVIGGFTISIRTAGRDVSIGL